MFTITVPTSLNLFLLMLQIVGVLKKFMLIWEEFCGFAFNLVGKEILI